MQPVGGPVGKQRAVQLVDHQDQDVGGARIIGPGQPRTHRATVDRQDVAHGGEEDLFLVAEVVMRQRRRDPGAARDPADGDVERARMADLGDGRLDQRLASDRLHTELRHSGTPENACAPRLAGR
jgi:hypothetical protein